MSYAIGAYDNPISYRPSVYFDEYNKYTEDLLKKRREYWQKILNPIYVKKEEEVKVNETAKIVEEPGAVYICAPNVLDVAEIMKGAEVTSIRRVGHSYAKPQPVKRSVKKSKAKVSKRK